MLIQMANTDSVRGFLKLTHDNNNRKLFGDATSALLILSFSQHFYLVKWKKVCRAKRLEQVIFL